MNCPNCAALCGSEDRYCYKCGTALYLLPPSQKGSHWVPMLILLIMSVVGISLFFLTAGNSSGVSYDGSCFGIKDGVLYFNEDAYAGDEELTVPAQINGQTVSHIGADCFAGCDSIVTVFLPDTVQTIDSGAFSGCTALRGMVIPSSVSSIGDEAFYGCSALEAIYIQSSMTHIGANAFDHCNYLGYIFYDGIYDDWCALYQEFINPYVGVFCLDGSFYQGGNVYD